MPERTFSSPDYRYGFNGKEKDEEGEWGDLTHYDYGFRIYNPGVGRFLSVDPLTIKYPMWSPYPYGMNRPIDGVDLDGLENIDADLLQQDAATILPTIGAKAIMGLFNSAETLSSWVAPKSTYVSAVKRHAERLGIELPEGISDEEIYANYDIDFKWETGFTPEPYESGFSEATELVVDALDIYGFSGGSASTVLSAKVPGTLADLLKSVPLKEIVKGVNQVKGCRNCSSTVVAVDKRLKGDLSAIAKGDDAVQTGGVNSYIKNKFGSAEISTTVGNFGDIIQSIKPGQTGIVTISPAGSLDGHAFNIINNGGSIKILDGQTEQVLKVDQLKGYLSRFDNSRAAYFYNTTNKTQ